MGLAAGESKLLRLAGVGVWAKNAEETAAMLRPEVGREVHVGVDVMTQILSVAARVGIGRLSDVAEAVYALIIQPWLQRADVRTLTITADDYDGVKRMGLKDATQKKRSQDNKVVPYPEPEALEFCADPGVDGFADGSPVDVERVFFTRPLRGRFYRAVRDILLAKMRARPSDFFRAGQQLVFDFCDGTSVVVGADGVARPEPTAHGYVEADQTVLYCPIARARAAGLPLSRTRLVFVTIDTDVIVNGLFFLRRYYGHDYAKLSMQWVRYQMLGVDFRALVASFFERVCPDPRIAIFFYGMLGTDFVDGPGLLGAGIGVTRLRRYGLEVVGSESHRRVMSGLLDRGRVSEAADYYARALWSVAAAAFFGASTAAEARKALVRPSAPREAYVWVGIEDALRKHKALKMRAPTPEMRAAGVRQLCDSYGYWTAVPEDAPAELAGLGAPPS